MRRAFPARARGGGRRRAARPRHRLLPRDLARRARRMGGGALRARTAPWSRWCLGTQSNGQGHETSFPQIAADLLGLPIDRLPSRAGRYAPVARGNGHGGARSLHMGGRRWCRAIDGAGQGPRASPRTCCRPIRGALDFAAGRFTVAAARAASTLPAVAAAARDPANLPDGMARLSMRPITPRTCSPSRMAAMWPRSRSTPKPAPCPRTLHRGRRLRAADQPDAHAGQVQGGLAQGIGQALLEHIGLRSGVGPAAERLA
jgi:aerobic carbon-monoxide dehydrogenase large subunit